MSLAALWTGLLAGPLVWLIYLQINYMLVPWVCHSGHKAVLVWVTAAALIITLAVTFIAWRAWHSAGATAATEDDNRFGRGRFMALTGIGLAALSTLLVIVSFIPIFVLGACD
jgi:hypothetical protein